MTTQILQLDTADLEQALENVVQRVVAEHSDDVWMTVEQAASHLSMTEQALRLMLRRGRVPHFRVGERRIRFSRADLDQWIRSREAEAA